MKTKLLLCDVVMLPTEKESKLHSDGHQILLEDKEFPNSGKTINQHLYLTSDKDIKIGDWFIVHVAIKEVFNESKTIFQASEQKHLDIVNAIQNKYKEKLKIEVTTDDLRISSGVISIRKATPKISQSFLKEFIQKEGNIKEVNVELEDKGRFSYDHGGNIWIPKLVIKTDEDDMVIIHPAEMFTRKELIEKLILFGEHVSEKCTGTKLEMIGEIFEWSKKNL